MVDRHLLRAVRDEISELKRQNRILQIENDRLWKIIGLLNDLQEGLQTFYTSSDLQQLMMDILQISLEAARSRNGSVMLLDEEENQLVFVAVVGERQKELTDYRIPANAGIAGWVKENQKPALVLDVRKDDRWLSMVDQSIGFHTCCLMAVPLQLGGKVLGVMEVVNSLTETHFEHKDLALLQLVAGMSSMIIGCAEEAIQEAQTLISKSSLN